VVTGNPLLFPSLKGRGNQWKIESHPRVLSAPLSDTLHLNRIRSVYAPREAFSKTASPPTRHSRRRQRGTLVSARNQSVNFRLNGRRLIPFSPTSQLLSALTKPLPHRNFFKVRPRLPTYPCIRRVHFRQNPSVNRDPVSDSR